jgi:hypothetical protein
MSGSLAAIGTPTTVVMRDIPHEARAKICNTEGRDGDAPNRGPMWRSDVPTRGACENGGCFHIGCTRAAAVLLAHMD